MKWLEYYWDTEPWFELFQKIRNQIRVTSHEVAVKALLRTDPLTMYGSVHWCHVILRNFMRGFPSYFLFHVSWRQSRSVHPSGYLAAEILANCHQNWGVLLLFNRSLVHLDSPILLSTCSDLRPLPFRFTTLHCVAVFLLFENKCVKL